MESSKQKLNLFLVLSWMHFRTSDYKSFMGACWSFMGPSISFIITYFLFEDRFGKQIPYFTIHLLTGIVVLTSFKLIVNHTIPFIERSRGILINSNTPAEIMLFSSMTVPFVKFFVEITLCVTIAGLLGILDYKNIPLIYLLTLALIPMAIGFGLILLTLNSFAGDVVEIWQITSQMLYFLTPMFYTLDMLSPWGRSIVLFFNPITCFVLSYQALITGQETPYFSPLSFFQCFLYSLTAFVVGYIGFKRVEKEMIERA